MPAAGSPDDRSDWLRKERERVRKWRALRSATGRDIGRLPPVVDPERKRACGHSLKLFAQIYQPKTYAKPFSADHDLVIETMERCGLLGGLFSVAMPRGSGKTSLCESFALWATLYGYHRYIVLLGATVQGGGKMLESIKNELRSNEALLADFPEVCYPIHLLEGITNRSAGQRYLGQPTYMRWSGRTIILPTIPGSAASSAALTADGLGSEGIRGKKLKAPDGSTMRPTLVIMDDPQTDRSARNPDSCQKLEGIISGAVLGMAGPGQKIAGIMPCTVIEEGDLADRMLDRAQHPEWNGIKTKTLYSFPTNEALWREYAEIRAESLRQGNNGREATEFYAKNREAMDEGAAVAWKDRFRDDELSALQSAMNRYFRDRVAFMAEDQNDPIRRGGENYVKILTATQAMEKVNRVPRGELPAETSIVTAFIDVQQKVLWWLVAAWSPDFGGAVVDYGTWPDQKRPYVTLSDLKTTIEDVADEGVQGLEAQLYYAIDQCSRMLASREFKRADGGALHMNRILVDAGYQTNTVYKVCRQSAWAALLQPSHGKGIGAKHTPIGNWAKQEGERRGPEWVLRRAANHRATRHVTFDTNFWKSFVHARLSAGLGDPTALSLFGERPADHRMLADHLCSSEIPTRVEANGRTVDEWAALPGRPDNHLLDCLVGAAVGASLEGCELQVTPSELQEREKAKRSRVRRNHVSYLE